MGLNDLSLVWNIYQSLFVCRKLPTSIFQLLSIFLWQQNIQQKCIQLILGFAGKDSIMGYWLDVSYVNNYLLVLFVCLECFVPLQIVSLIWRPQHCRCRAANFNICTTLMVVDQWGFFRVPQLLWLGCYNAFWKKSGVKIRHINALWKFKKNSGNQILHDLL